jgi:hypothetical protein
VDPRSVVFFDCRWSSTRGFPARLRPPRRPQPPRSRLRAGLSIQKGIEVARRHCSGAAAAARSSVMRTKGRRRSGDRSNHGRRGVRQLTENPEENAVFSPTGAVSGALPFEPSDPRSEEAAELTRSWPILPPAMREAIVALVRSVRASQDA